MGWLEDLLFIWLWNTTVFLLIGAPVLGIVWWVAYVLRPQDD